MQIPLLWFAIKHLWFNLEIVMFEKSISGTITKMSVSSMAL